METDPIVEEVRTIRHQIDRECEMDPGTYYEHVKDFQQNFRARLVCLRPRPLSVSPQKQRG